MAAIGMQEQVRLSQAKQFGQMMLRFEEMPYPDQDMVRRAIWNFPTHPDAADNDDAIRTIAEAFWPDMKDD